MLTPSKKSGSCACDKNMYKLKVTKYDEKNGLPIFEINLEQHLFSVFRSSVCTCICSIYLPYENILYTRTITI